MNTIKILIEKAFPTAETARQFNAQISRENREKADLLKKQKEARRAEKEAAEKEAKNQKEAKPKPKKNQSKPK